MAIFSELLRQYGEEAVLSTEAGESTVRIFLQPVIRMYRDGRYQEMTGLGELDLARYYYFGPAETAISDPGNTTLRCGGKEYVFLKAEPYKVGKTVSHWEGVLCGREEQADDGA